MLSKFSCFVRYTKTQHRLYTIQVAVCKEYNKPLKICSQESKAIQNANEVKIKTVSCGLNFAGKYQERSTCPFIPGLEFSGVVKEIGKNKGDKVLGILSKNGGFSEEVITQDNNLYKLSSNINLNEITCFGVNYQTAILGLQYKAHLRPNDTVLITGSTGGTGLAAIQICQAIGSKIITVYHEESKKNILSEKYGIPNEYIISDQLPIKEFSNKVKQRTNGGVDVVFDPVGGDTFMKCFKSIKWNANIIFNFDFIIGFSGGIVQQIPMNHVLVKNSSVIGVYLGGFKKNRPEVIEQGVNQLCKWYEEGKIKPLVYRHFKLEEINEAMKVMKEGKHYGKIIIDM